MNGIYLDPNDKATKLDRLTVTEAIEMIETGKATGMIPKLQSLTSIVERGVHSAMLSVDPRNALYQRFY